MNDQYIQDIEVSQFSEQAYLDYSMHVVTARAIPHVSDGLKPVQRRIVYAMSELGLDNKSKYKKSARTVGDVLGKYHPHGDSACYEAMVLMSQSFSYRYTLIDGQGNWGSQDDPKSFAAMRYTEARLSSYTQNLLSEIGQDTVEFGPNFDGTMQEPIVLPSQVPNILINGTSGIAVGMSTDIPSHNLVEVVNACQAILRDKDIGLEELMEYVSAPDLPTNAEIITPKSEMADIYRTGTGSFKMRACYNEEGKNSIIITALPHLVSGEKIIEDIAGIMRSGKLPMLENIRDESDHENPTRIMLEYKKSSGVNASDIMDHLFAKTDLEKNYRVNMNVIGLNARPQVKNLLMMLTEWLTFRTTTVTRKLNFRLRNINKRLHIIEGMIIAYLNIDRVIEIIRTEDDPRSKLMSEFSITEIQANAILDTRLRQLAKLEESILRTERDKLLAEKDGIEKTLAQPEKMNQYIIDDLERIKKEFGDERRSPIVIRDGAKTLSTETLVKSEPVTVVLSKKGWLKMAKGHSIDASTLNYKTGDELQMALRTQLDRSTVALSDQGKSYSIPTHLLPSARSHGEHVGVYASLKEGDFVRQIIDGDLKAKYLVSSTLGYGFITPGEELQSKRKSGKQLLNVGDGKPLPVRKLDKNDDHIIIVTKGGYCIVFEVGFLTELSKGKGNKMAIIKEGDSIVYVDTFCMEDHIRLTVNGRTSELSRDTLGMAIGKRGRAGFRLFKTVTSIEREVTKETEEK